MAECGGSDCLEPQRRVGHWWLYQLFFFSNGRVREGGGRWGCQGVQGGSRSQAFSYGRCANGRQRFTCSRKNISVGKHVYNKALKNLNILLKTSRIQPYLTISFVKGPWDILKPASVFFSCDLTYDPIHPIHNVHTRVGK